MYFGKRRLRFLLQASMVCYGEDFFLEIGKNSTGPSSQNFCESMTFSFRKGSDQVVGIRNDPDDVRFITNSYLIIPLMTI